MNSLLLKLFYLGFYRCAGGSSQYNRTLLQHHFSNILPQFNSPSFVRAVVGVKSANHARQLDMMVLVTTAEDVQLMVGSM